MPLKTQFIPAAEAASKRLMLVMHGLGDSTAGYTWLPAAMRLPWLNYLLVNAPDPYYGGYSWFDFMGDANPGIERSRAWIVDLLDEQRRRGFPTDQTLLFGFSQGCLMALEVGLTYPQRFAGIVGISGFVVDLDSLLARLSPQAKEQRLLITHGRWDNLLPMGVTKAQIQRLIAAGLAIEWREFDKDHTIAGEEELAVLRDFIKKSYPQ